MENIVIVHAVSTGYNLVDDVLARGFYPVVLNILLPGGGADKSREAVRSRIEGKCRFIDECPEYSDTLEKVRQLKPRVVVAGSEAGVVLATRLAEDLGLVGNPTALLPQMTQKAAMHEALRKHGIRSIRGKLVSTPEEAAAFYDELSVKQVIVKQNGGASSVGLHACSSREEVMEAVRTEVGTADHFGRTMRSVLIQEMIIGTEYIVNTVSCAGAVRLTSIYRYMKTRTETGSIIYRYAESINKLDMEQYELIRYAFQAVQALGIRYGEVHGEYMVDERGPVLIEVNCRPMGLTMPAAFLDMYNGQHETDSHLDSYLYPEKFAEEARKPFRTDCKLAAKTLSSKTEKTLLASPILVIAPKLKSYFSADLKVAVSEVLPSTEDLSSSCGTLYLAHPDGGVVMQEVLLLNELEDSYSDMLYEDATYKLQDTAADNRETSPEDIIRLFDFGDKYTLFDSSVDNVIDSEKDSFDNVIICYSGKGDKEWTMEDAIGAVFYLVRFMKKGAKLVFMRSTHDMDKNAIARLVAILKLTGLTVECPIPGHLDIVVGTAE